MALIYCTECGSQISDMAAACPHCGFPVAQNQMMQPQYQQTYQQPVQQVYQQPVQQPVYYQQPYQQPIQEVNNGKKKDSPLSLVAAICALFTVSCVIGVIIGLIDVAIYGKDGRRHLGSWFAIIYGVLVAIVFFALR